MIEAEVFNPSSPKIYDLNVMETKPAAAVSIIECDMNVDFEVLVSVEKFGAIVLVSGTSRVRGAQGVQASANGRGGTRVGCVSGFHSSKLIDFHFNDVSQMLPEEQGFIAFAGSGNRLDGKKKRTNSETEIQSR